MKPRPYGILRYLLGILTALKVSKQVKPKHFEIIERLLQTSKLHFSTNYLFTILHLAWRRPNNEEPILTTLERRLVLL